MSDFQTTTTPRSLKPRLCPECGETIQPGERYARIAGAYDGDFISAIQCLPCQAFGDRFLASLELSACLNWDEKTYQFGDMLNEAAEYLGHLWAEGYDEQTGPERRTAMMALFDEGDAAEREAQKRDRELRRAASPPSPALVLEA